MNSDDNLVSRYANDTKQFGGRPTEDPSTDDPQTAEDGKMATPPDVGVDGSPVFVLVGAVIPRCIYAGVTRRQVRDSADSMQIPAEYTIHTSIHSQSRR